MDRNARAPTTAPAPQRVCGTGSRLRPAAVSEKNNPRMSTTVEPRKRRSIEPPAINREGNPLLTDLIALPDVIGRQRMAFRSHLPNQAQQPTVTNAVNCADRREPPRVDGH